MEIEKCLEGFVKIESVEKIKPQLTILLKEIENTETEDELDAIENSLASLLKVVNKKQMKEMGFYKFENGWRTLKDCRGLESFYDHPFSVCQKDLTGKRIKAYVTEPYNLNRNSIEKLNKFCDKNNLTWVMGLYFKALYYPNKTIPIYLIEKKDI